MAVSDAESPSPIAVRVPHAAPSAANAAACQSNRANANRTPRPIQGELENTSSARPALHALLAKITNSGKAAGQATDGSGNGDAAHQLSCGQSNHTAANAIT